MLQKSDNLFKCANILVFTVSAKDMVMSDKSLQAMVLKNLPKKDHLPLKRVLYLEDDHISFLFVKKLLESCVEKYNFQVDIANNVNEAKQMLTDLSYDVVLVDLYLPSRSGFDLLEHRKTSAKLIATPFVVISGFSDDETKMKAHALGIDKYVTKPIYDYHFTDTICDLI